MLKLSEGPTTAPAERGFQGDRGTMGEIIRHGVSGTGSHSAPAAGAPQDRTGGERRAVMIPATIVCPDGDSYACVIRDMSPAGAKLSVSQRHRLPPAFTLAIAGRGGSYPVRRSWQRGDLAEVTLVVAGPAG